MKKLIVLILALLLLFALCSCDEVPQFTEDIPLPQLTKNTPVTERFEFDDIDGYIECTVSYYDEYFVEVTMENGTDELFYYGIGPFTMYKKNFWGKYKEVEPIYSGKDYQTPAIAFGFDPGEIINLVARQSPDPYPELKSGKYMVASDDFDYMLPNGKYQKVHISIEFSI